MGQITHFVQNEESALVPQGPIPVPDVGDVPEKYIRKASTQEEQVSNEFRQAASAFARCLDEIEGVPGFNVTREWNDDDALVTKVVPSPELSERDSRFRFHAFSSRRYVRFSDGVVREVVEMNVSDTNPMKEKFFFAMQCERGDIWVGEGEGMVSFEKSRDYFISKYSEMYRRVSAFIEGYRTETRALQRFLP